MKKKLFSALLLLVTTISVCAQKVDLTTYKVVAKSGDVTIIMKDNDYRMIVGSVKKPKLNMLMGYSKEQAINRIDRIMEFSNEQYTRKNRNVSVCGVMLVLSVTGEGDKENYHFEALGLKGKFDLTVEDYRSFKNSIHQLQ